MWLIMEFIKALLEWLGIGEVAKERRKRNHLLNRLEPEISLNVKQLSEAHSHLSYIRESSRKRRSWKIGVPQQYTNYQTDVYDRVQGDLGLLQPGTNELLTCFYKLLRKANSYKDELAFKPGSHASELVKQQVDLGATEEDARSDLYPDLLFDLRVVIGEALDIGKQLEQAIKVERTSWLERIRKNFLKTKMFFSFPASLGCLGRAHMKIVYF